MRASQLIKVIPSLLSIQRSVFIKGPVGVGKSSIINQIAESHGWQVSDVRMSQMDPTDIKGFPAPDTKKNQMRWLTPDFLPTDPKSKGILFLDELTSAPTAVQAAGYQLLLDRRVGEYRLPDGWGIIGAGNREIDRSIVNRMPAALANRLVHLELEAHIEDFSTWAVQTDAIDPITLAFLRFRPDLLHSFDPNSKNASFPTPRTWEFVSQIRKLGLEADLEHESIKGTVGDAAGEYRAFVATAGKLPSIEQIMLNPQGTEVPDDPCLLYALSTTLSMHTGKKQDFQTIVQYVERLPVEFQTTYMRDVLSKPAVGVATTKEFRTWSIRNADFLF